MAGITSNIFVGAPDRVTGAIMVAPTGTALPTSISTAPNVLFQDLGFVSEDGVSVSQSSSWETIKDWGGDQVRKFLSDFTGTLNFTLLETNPEVLKYVYGSAQVTTTAATVSSGTLNAIKLNSSEPPTASLIVNILDTPRKIRIVVPNSQVTERGDLKFSRTSALMHQLTVESYPDATGNSIYVYTDDGKFSA